MAFGAGNTAALLHQNRRPYVRIIDHQGTTDAANRIVSYRCGCAHVGLRAGL